MQDRGPAAYIAEFVGTLLLVFFITAAVSVYVTAPSAANPNPFIDFSVIGLVHVFVLFVLIQTLAVVSGAHFNPAVTAAMTMLRQIKPPDAAIYVGLQFLGAIAGAFLTKALLLDEGAASNYGAVAVSDALNGKILPGMVCEGLGTFFLLWAIIGRGRQPARDQGVGRVRDRRRARHGGDGVRPADRCGPQSGPRLRPRPGVRATGAALTPSSSSTWSPRSWERS